VGPVPRHRKDNVRQGRPRRAAASAIGSAVAAVRDRDARTLVGVNDNMTLKVKRPVGFLPVLSEKALHRVPDQALSSRLFPGQTTVRIDLPSPRKKRPRLEAGGVDAPPPPKRMRLAAPGRLSCPVMVRPEAQAPRPFQPEPPCRLLSPAQAEEAAARFRANLDKGWQAADTPGAESSAEQIVWHERLVQTSMVLSSVALEVDDADAVLGMFFDGEPIGMAVLRRPSLSAADAGTERATHARVVEFVTHPGAGGAGGVMVEQMVNLSESWGCEGRLLLGPNGDETKAIYRSFGFIERQGRMLLTPADGEGPWSRDHGPWQLARHAGSALLSASDDPAGVQHGADPASPD
jgi:hypothetical protein